MVGFRKVLALLALLFVYTEQSSITMKDRVNALETRILVDSWKTTQELERLDKLINEIHPAEQKPRDDDGVFQELNQRMDSLEISVDSFTKHMQKTLDVLAKGLTREKLLQRKMMESIRFEMLNHTNEIQALENETNVDKHMNIDGILKDNMDTKTLEQMKPYVLEILRDIDPNSFGKQRLRSECPNDWFRIKDTCYLYIKEKRTWDNARQTCNDLGAILAEPNDAQILDAINAVRTTDVWIGGTDALKEGTWMWKGSNKELTYFAWREGQPNSYGGNQDCLEIWFKKFNDEDCNRTTHFVCEKYIGVA